MEEVSSAATGSTVVDLSGDSHLQVRVGGLVGRMADVGCPPTTDLKNKIKQF